MNFGFKVFRRTGRIDKAAMELTSITKQIKNPKSDKMRKSENTRTAKPAPTEIALKRIALPEP